MGILCSHLFILVNIFKKYLVHENKFNFIPVNHNIKLNTASRTHGKLKITNSSTFFFNIIILLNPPPLIKVL